MSIYNDMCMVSPQGKVHSTMGLSHPDWCHENRTLIDWHGTKTLDYERTEDDDEAYIDDNEHTALDAFKMEGWIRVKPGFGIEVGGVYEHNLPLIKRVLRAMLKDDPDRSLYVDDGEGSSKRVGMTVTGRPDFRELDEFVARGGYYAPVVSREGRFPG